MKIASVITTILTTLLMKREGREEMGGRENSNFICKKNKKPSENQLNFYDQNLR